MSSLQQPSICSKTEPTSKALPTIRKPDRIRLVGAIDRLCGTRAVSPKLKGEFEGVCRLRIGLTQVASEWREDELVVRIGQRRKAYRQLKV